MKAISEFDLDYVQALRIIMNSMPTRNLRTGKEVRATASLVFQLNPRAVPLMTLRDIKPLWACAEAVWFMGGGHKADFMRGFGFKVWDKFADADGCVNSATGYRWRSHFKVDQLKELVKKLSADPTNRQAILCSWDPLEDNLRPGANVPCVDMWHFHILEGALHLSVLQRSGDMYFGVPHDILGSRIVQELIAAGIGAEVGMMSYSVSNGHLYEDQWQAAEEMISRMEKIINSFQIKKVKLENLELTKDDFVSAMVCDERLPLKLAARIAKQYKPWPSIIGPKLVL